MGGRVIPTKWSMINRVKPGHRTDFEILHAAFDTRISGRVFSFQELEQNN
jgi:hypothetical protein